jgi:hypothetical protein
MAIFLVYYEYFIYNEFKDFLIYLTWLAMFCIVMAQMHDPSSGVFPFIDSNTVPLELKSVC